MKGKHKPQPKKDIVVLPKQQAWNKQLSNGNISEWLGRDKWKSRFAPESFASKHKMVLA